VTLATGKIHQGDCVSLLERLEPGSIDLAFADPPFNIGYDYDQYDDRRSCHDYLDWSKQWMTGVARALADDGAFWLAIGDEYAAELKVIATRELGLTMRSWVIWYYTFGVNCTRKFSRSHAHLFHFAKDPQRFTFNADDLHVRVPSARALVYGDKRANPKGRLPDDTWVLRPQDLPDSFQPGEDTWYFARVAGTFKEREGFHGCQMPEQLLGRIVRVSSNVGDTVLDPFSGSGTTLAVAEKLGRNWIGFELSDDYARHASERLREITPGDPLDGPADPLISAPSTAKGVRLATNGKRIQPAPRGQEVLSDGTSPHALDNAYSQSDFADSLVKESVGQAVREAFLLSHEGYSVERLLADPGLADSFVKKCRHFGVPGKPVDWNRMLLRLRKKKSGLALESMCRKAELSNDVFDRIGFASEIAWQTLRRDYEWSSLDEIFCDSKKARIFDKIAKKLVPGFPAVDYRWAAYRIRKRARYIRLRRQNLSNDLLRWRVPSLRPVDEIKPAATNDSQGLYILADDERTPFYVGETVHLVQRIADHLNQNATDHVPQVAHAGILYLDRDFAACDRFGLFSEFIRRKHTEFNYPRFVA